MDGREYSVSEAVQLTGVPSHVLRYWEEELQIEIRRTNQGHRIYSEKDVEMFRRVKELKEKGIQLKAIRVLLDELVSEDAPPEEASGLTGKIREIERRTSDQYPETEIKMECASSGEEKEDGSRGKIFETETGDAGEVEQYEIIVDEKKENLRRFEAILKRLIQEVVEEQNEKLEQAITGIIREEINDLYVQYFGDGIREAAAAAPDKGKLIGSLRKLLKRYRTGRK